MAPSILSRKRDLAYFIHFCISVPICFLVDMQSIYPPSTVPAWMGSIKDYYMSTYNDHFFIAPPPFFKLFMATEPLIQVPVMLWAIPALLRNSPKIPLGLFPLSLLVFISTAVCIFDMFHWDTSLDQKLNLCTLYGPYLALATFMMADMFFRLNSLINKALTLEAAIASKKRE